MLANTNLEVVLGMLFLVFSNTDIQFSIEELTWRIYTIAEALPTISRVELIDKREFAKTILNENLKTFVVHISALDITESSIYPFQATQITIL